MSAIKAWSIVFLVVMLNIVNFGMIVPFLINQDSTLLMVVTGIELFAVIAVSVKSLNYVYNLRSPTNQ